MLLATVLLVALAAPPQDAISAPPGAAAPPDPIASLTSTLARLPATTPLRARVDHRVLFTQGGEEKVPPAGNVSALVSAGPEGLRVSFAPALLARAEAEERERLSNPDAYAPTRDALSDLRTLALARAVDAVPDLLRVLFEAKVVADRVEPFDGAPTRVLDLQIKPAIAARDRRYVKDVEATTRIWLGPDGVPLAEERHVLLKGRIFLIITFDIEQRERIRYARSGDRLVVARHESEYRSSGAGEKRDREAATTLTILP